MLQLWPGSVDVEPECCDEKSVSCRVKFEAKFRETTGHDAGVESVIAITPFQTGVSWHFCSFKDDILKIEV